MKALHQQSLVELRQTLHTKAASAVEVAQHFLARAQADTHGAFLAFNEDATLAQAREADARISAGNPRTLDGLPLAHKDVFVTRDFPTTAGSKILQGYRSPFDATVVQRLADQGMVSLGKLNCDEFAMGSANENSAYGSVKNPWDARRPWPPAWCPPPPAPIRVARSDNPRRFAASRASSPPMAAPAATA
jgi:aspartyl-tRNA(Asn)/glutamyl-tRNA(Gln) amidotransferase subunit A